MKSIWTLTLLALASCITLQFGPGCASAPPVAYEAIRQERITLGTPTEDVRRIAGPPDIVLAESGVETLFYVRKDKDNKAVSISVVNGKVVAFRDTDVWPEGAAKAAEESDHPVSTGRVFLGMTEADVRSTMGSPNGITAEKGVEQLHWLTGDEVDSVVALKDGVVTGYWDHLVTDLSQNLPTEGNDREESTTGGKIRVGMTSEDVQKLLGEPDERSGEKGVITHVYESDPFFGDEILYKVGYTDGHVTHLSEFNLDRDEDKKEEAARAQREAAVAAQRDTTTSILSTVLSNPLVQTALKDAIGAPKKKVIKKKTVQTSEKRTLTINGKTYTGGKYLGQSCNLNAPCPNTYVCHLITDKSGMCVPEGQ